MRLSQQFSSHLFYDKIQVINGPSKVLHSNYISRLTFTWWLLPFLVFTNISHKLKFTVRKKATFESLCHIREEKKVILLTLKRVKNGWKEPENVEIVFAAIWSNRWWKCLFAVPLTFSSMGLKLAGISSNKLHFYLSAINRFDLTVFATLCVLLHIVSANVWLFFFSFSLSIGRAFLR